jgi:hypothetical protein
MAKIRTKTKINWGGFNPEIPNTIISTATELVKNENGCAFQIRDVAMLEHEVLDETGEVVSTYETEFQETRAPKNIPITSEQYDQLFNVSNQYMDFHYPNLTTLQREVKRLDVAFYLYFTTDFLDNGLCGYNTDSTDWEIVE